MQLNKPSDEPEKLTQQLTPEKATKTDTEREALEPFVDRIQHFLDRLEVSND